MSRWREMTRTVLVSEPETCHEQDPHARPAPTAISVQNAIGLPTAEQAAADLLHALGMRTDEDSLRDTPRQMVQAYQELPSPRLFTLTTSPNTERYDELATYGSVDVCFSNAGVSGSETWVERIDGVRIRTVRMGASAGRQPHETMFRTPAVVVEGCS
jgi:hypothetical protein